VGDPGPYLHSEGGKVAGNQGRGFELTVPQFGIGMDLVARFDYCFLTGRDRTVDAFAVLPRLG
jgi:hypothetical protein